MTLKYDGRVLVVTAVVNTEADPYDVRKRVTRALRGDRLDAVVMKIEGYSGRAGEIAWKAAQQVVTKVAAHPDVQPTDGPIKLTQHVGSVREIVKGLPAGALDVASVQDAIMALERVNADLVSRGLSFAELAGLEIGAGVGLLRDSGASREKVLEAVAMLYDRKIDAIVGREEPS
jgi:hypothetical protein